MEISTHLIVLHLRRTPTFQVFVLSYRDISVARSSCSLKRGTLLDLLLQRVQVNDNHRNM